MRRSLAVFVALAPVAAGAQQVTVTTRGESRAAAIVDSVKLKPYAVRAGTGPLVFPRDSTITTSLIVLGRPTYLASKVQGDVVVVGGDLFLRPGAEISGRAVAIGGTVAQTSLGSVAGPIESLRDETLVATRDAVGDGYTLTVQRLRPEGETPGVFRLAGIRGLIIPSYDRVDGLSLPVGILVVPREDLVVAPTLTYRSRLGVIDPAVGLRVGAEEGRRFEGRVGRVTRSNDLWITSEIMNSLKTFAFGTDTRNYFRSDIAEGRFFAPHSSERAALEPFVGARFERVSPVTATGNVYSILQRGDSDRVRRPNPLVEPGHLASALAGLAWRSLPEDAPVTTRLSLEGEQSFTVPAGTSNFTQLTADGEVQFPTILTHSLHIRGHAVGTIGGDSVPRARYAYLGGSRTLGLSQLLELGGTQLVFIDSRYQIPLSVQLPVVGPPLLSLIHRIGGAGVGTLGSLRQEVGVGLTLGPLDLDVITGASGQHRTRFGIGLSMPAL